MNWRDRDEAGEPQLEFLKPTATAPKTPRLYADSPCRRWLYSVGYAAGKGWDAAVLSADGPANRPWTMLLEGTPFRTIAERACVKHLAANPPATDAKK